MNVNNVNDIINQQIQKPLIDSKGTIREVYHSPKREGVTQIMTKYDIGGGGMSKNIVLLSKKLEFK